MWLRKAANLMERGLLPFTTILGNIGAGIIGMMMLLTVADVTGRYVFNQPIFGAHEISEFMLVIVVFFTMAHCELLRSHVTIGLVVSRLRQRTQDSIDSIMYVFFLTASCWLTWQLCLYAKAEWHGQISRELGIAVLPFISVAAFGCAVLSLVILMHLLLFLAGILKR